ncbi:MAG: hypothetical protein CHACPFDD_03654 [Phycisphaerae bacterium]|nr:hypothetical protein [Phycisphaerae bacterium]
MSCSCRLSRFALLVAALCGSVVAQAQSAEDSFYRAFYLETEKGDFKAAADLYAQVASAGNADARLRAESQARLNGCREELACTDFARLMPAGTFAYVELNNPGDQLCQLARSLGILREPGAVGAEPAQRFAISPALIKEVLGVRGAAVALTGIDPMKGGMPRGVAVFHPGDLEIVRGLIETALPVAAQPAKPIEGHTTYNIENQVLVTLTSRLVIASMQESEIAGVIQRLNGKGKDSLATSPALAEAMQGRDGSLLFFCVNAKPIMPMLNVATGAAGMSTSEMKLVQALLDPDSVRSLAGHVRITPGGADADLSVFLEKDHENVVFNLLRTPAVDQSTLRCIPEGAAAFLVGALNEAPSRFPQRAESDQPQGKSAVSLLDLGREVFANIVGFGVFVIPGEGAAGGGPPIPDVAAVISVNDPAKSKALWTLGLGLASLAAGADSKEGDPVEVDGVRVTAYHFPEGIVVYYGNDGNDVIISPSKLAISRALAAKRGGKSVANDKAFSAVIGRIGPDTNFALIAHAGRCMEVARRFMPEGDVREIEPFIGLMSETVIAETIDHGPNSLRLTWTLSGLPKIGGLVSRLIEETRNGAGLVAMHQARHDQDEPDVRALPWGGENAAKNVRLVAPKPADRILAKFNKLAAKGDPDAALKLADKLAESLWNDAPRLNELAWRMLTEDEYGDAYTDLALRLSTRSNELTGLSDWMLVDTLALARFKSGDIEEAIRLERKAVELCGSGARCSEARDALKRFEAAHQQETAAR